MDHIKQLRIYPPENGKCDLIVIYEIEGPEQLSQNGHYLSIDFGLHNLMTCYDSGSGRTFILGRGCRTKYVRSSFSCAKNNCQTSKESGSWCKIKLCD